MTGLHRVFDAEFPPAEAPPGCSGVLGYLGGGRAANVWTLEEWERFAHLIQFPAWVPDPIENPAATAARAGVALRSLGWAPWQQDRRVIVCDLETEIEPGWYQSFASGISAQGYTAVAYGSLSTILANAAADVWVAAWDGDPVLEPGQTIHAHQYADDMMTPSGTPVDYSVVDEWLMARGGQGPRHA